MVCCHVRLWSGLWLFSFGKENFNVRGFGKENFNVRGFGKENFNVRGFGKENFNVRGFGKENVNIRGQEINNKRNKNFINIGLIIWIQIKEFFKYKMIIPKTDVFMLFCNNM